MSVVDPLPVQPGDVLDADNGEMWIVLTVSVPEDRVPTVTYLPVTVSKGTTGTRFHGWGERTHTLAAVREFAPEKVLPELAAEVLRWWRGS